MDRVLGGAMDDGLAALAQGRWEEARAALSGVLSGGQLSGPDSAVAAGALSEALWWLGRVEESLAAREQACRTWRAAGEEAAAAREALWLAREYLRSEGNETAARGWLARAASLAERSGGPALGGWLALTRAMLASEPEEQRRFGEVALAEARSHDDGDLEVLALGRTGLALISVGDEDAGLAHFDEAMAMATGGEAALGTLATLCCDLVQASERSGELERFAQWNEVVERVASQYGHGPLLSFCAACCAEAFAAAGDWNGAEAQLRIVLDLLRTRGGSAPCLTPAAKLAELLVAQGRFEEADQLVGDDDSDATLLARARLAHARGHARLAAALAERCCARLGGPSLASAAALALAVDAHLAAGDVDRAATAARHLEQVAARSANRRAAGRATLARARVALAEGGTAEDVAGLLEAALTALSAAAPGGLEVAEAHLELARLHRQRAPDVARAEARAALAGFEACGAARHADAAAALLRALGDRSRVGPKDIGILTRREQEVLRLLAQGLTNAEIADRLFISVKTAGNHVSSILSKLNLRSRSEAAAWAVVHPTASATDS